MLGGHERGDIVHRQRIDEGLIGLGVVAFIVHQCEALDLAHEWLKTLADGGQRVGTLLGIDLMACIDRGIERKLAVAGYQQGQTEWPEVRPLLLRVAALGEVGAEVIVGEIRKEVRGVVEQRIESESELMDHLAGQLRFNLWGSDSPKLASLA